MLTTYRAWQVTGEREFSLVERELVEPSPVRYASGMTWVVGAIAKQQTHRASRLTAPVNTLGNPCAAGTIRERSGACALA
jgi:hypothetical protein